MSEKELDSSVNEYEEEQKSSNYTKQLQWDMAIGLQEVDNLNLRKTIRKIIKPRTTWQRLCILSKKKYGLFNIS